MNDLILLVGVSGSGKSTYARSFCAQTGAVHLSSDECRGVLSGDENNQEVSGRAFELLRNMTRYFLRRGQNVVVDATNLNPKSRKDFVEIGRQFHAFIHAYCFKTDLTVAKERNKTRSRVVPEHVIDAQSAKCVWPTVGEVDNVIFIANESRS